MVVLFLSVVYKLQMCVAGIDGGTTFYAEASVGWPIFMPPNNGDIFKASGYTYLRKHSPRESSLSKSLSNQQVLSVNPLCRDFSSKAHFVPFVGIL